MMFLTTLLLGIVFCQVLDMVSSKEIKVLFHRLPNELYRGVPFSAQCSICAEKKDKGQLILWALLSGEEASVIDKEKWANIIFEPGKNATDCHMTSLLEGEVVNELDNKRLACFLQNTDAQNCLMKGKSQCYDSPVIAVRTPPPEPISLEILSEKPVDKLVHKDFIKMQCIGCVEQSGHIFWAIIGPYGIVVLSRADPIVKELTKETNKTEKCSKLMTSVITVRVTASDTGKHFACYTFNAGSSKFNFPNLHWNKHTDTLKVAMKKLAFVDERGYINVLWYLMGITMLGVIFFLLINSPDDDSSLDADSLDKLQELDDLWNTEPESSRGTVEFRA